MKVLVTGGAGFKGCVVTEALLAAGHDVTVFDVLTYGEASAIALRRLGAQVVRGDVTDADPARAELVNVGGTRNVAAAIEPGQPFVYASTGSVYGRVDDICTEDQAPRPLTRYGRTKLEGERIALRAGGVALRFATVVGVSPCMRFDLMVNAFVYRAVHFGWLNLFQPHDRRSFLDVSDAASAYVFALEHAEAMSGGVFNVGNTALNLTKQQVAEAVAEQFPMVIEATDTRPDPDQRDYEVAFKRIENLGYAAQVPLTRSITEIGSVARLVTKAEDWRFVV